MLRTGIRDDGAWVSRRARARGVSRELASKTRDEDPNKERPFPPCPREDLFRFAVRNHVSEKIRTRVFSVPYPLRAGRPGDARGAGFRERREVLCSRREHALAYLTGAAPGVGAADAKARRAERFEAPIDFICTDCPARALRAARLGRTVQVAAGAGRPESIMAAIVCVARGQGVAPPKGGRCVFGMRGCARADAEKNPRFEITIFLSGCPRRAYVGADQWSICDDLPNRLPGTKGKRAFRRFFVFAVFFALFSFSIARGRFRPAATNLLNARLRDSASRHESSDSLKYRVKSFWKVLGRAFPRRG